MNREYVEIENNNYCVTDDVGHINERNIEGDVKNILIAENKVELIVDEINNMESRISNIKGLVNITTLFRIGNIILILESIITSLIWPIEAVVLTGATLSFIYIVEGVLVEGLRFCAKRRIKRISSKLSKANELKQNYEKELEKTKERKIEKEDLKEEKHQIYKLPSDEILRQEFDPQLDEAYNNIHKKKHKSLVLRYKNKH